MMHNSIEAKHNKKIIKYFFFIFFVVRPAIFSFIIHGYRKIRCAGSPGELTGFDSDFVPDGKH